MPFRATKAQRWFETMWHLMLPLVFGILIWDSWVLYPPSAALICTMFLGALYLHYLGIRIELAARRKAMLREKVEEEK